MRIFEKRALESRYNDKRKNKTIAAKAVALIIIIGLLTLTSCTPAKITTRRALNSPDGTSETAMDTEIEFISVSQEVSRGDTAEVQIRGKADTMYAIAVYYSSGASKAKGLEPTVADENGYVTWNWKIGSKTLDGEYKITVTGGGKSASTYFKVN